MGTKPQSPKEKIGEKKQPLKIIGDFVFETNGRIDLPL